MTERLAVSVVEKRRPQFGHCRRRRMARPSSLTRESTTLVSGWRQKGQCISPPVYPRRGGNDSGVIPRNQTLFRSGEPGVDGVAVGGQALGVREGADDRSCLTQRVQVVLHRLL